MPPGRIQPEPGRDSNDESIADIKAVTREQVVKFHADFYGAQTAELSVVGDFDAAELTKQATTLLGDWKSAKRFARIPYEYKDIAPQPQVIETPDKANAMFIAGTTIALSDRDADYPAVALGNFIFGGGFLKSRLFSRIRIAEGLSYSVGSQLLARPLDKAGGFFSFAIYAPQNAEKVEKTFNEELTRILTTDIPADELAQAKSGWMQSRSVSRSQDAELVRNLNGQTFLDRTMAWDADLEKRVMALDAAQIRAALNRYLSPAKFTVVKAGDFAGAAAKKPAN